MNDFILFFTGRQPNIKELNNGIDMFYAAHGYLPCIVCSKNTMNELQAYLVHTWIMYVCDIGDLINTYRNCKVRIDNTLPLGEIRLREEI